MVWSEAVRPGTIVEQRNNSHDSDEQMMRFAKKLSSQPFLNSRFAGYGLWLLISALLIPLFFQILTMILYLGQLVINNPDLRPTGWSSDTLVGLRRCGFLILGGLWIGLVMYLESYLSEAQQAGQLPQKSGRLILMMGVIYLVSALIPILFG
jgi:hypothetical protein